MKQGHYTNKKSEAFANRPYRATVLFGKTCKDCEKRHLGCHSTCEAYILRKEEYEEEKANLKRKRAEYFYHGNLRPYTY